MSLFKVNLNKSNGRYVSAEIETTSKDPYYNGIAKVLTCGISRTLMDGDYRNDETVRNMIYSNFVFIFEKIDKESVDIEL